YGRDNLKLSEHFLSVFRARLVPVLEEGLQRCPAAVLEVMMNGLLALETNEGAAAAKAFLLEIYRLRDMVLDSSPPDAENARRVRQLMVEWNADIAHVYPKLLDIERLGPNKTLPGGAAQEALQDDPRTIHSGAAQEADPQEDWCAGQRFFVYQLPDPSLYSPGTFYCLQGQWGTEVLMRHYFRHNCNTQDPQLADWFYVPMYATCRYVKLNENASQGDNKEALKDLDELSREHIWDPLLEFLRSSAWYHRHQ
ncbi:unnamed protein product, partial [Polarella glacialis]